MPAGRAGVAADGGAARPPEHAARRGCDARGSLARRPRTSSTANALSTQACVVCHGEDGKGGHGAGAPLDGVKDLAAAMQTVTAGRNNMPPFGATFTPEQIRDVSAYVVERSRGRQSCPVIGGTGPIGVLRPVSSPLISPFAHSQAGAA